MVPRSSCGLGDARQGGKGSPIELPAYSTSAATHCSFPCLPDYRNNQPTRSPFLNKC